MDVCWNKLVLLTTLNLTLSGFKQTYKTVKKQMDAAVDTNGALEKTLSYIILSHETKTN